MQNKKPFDLAAQQVNKKKTKRGDSYYVSVPSQDDKEAFKEKSVSFDLPDKKPKIMMFRIDWDNVNTLDDIKLILKYGLTYITIDSRNERSLAVIQELQDRGLVDSLGVDMDSALKDTKDNVMPSQEVEDSEKLDGSA